MESQTSSSDLSRTIYNFDQDDERRVLREELDKSRREIEFLRQKLQLNSNKNPIEEKEISTTIVGQSVQTTTTVSVDSGLDTSIPGMSNTFRSSTFELNEFKERERKLQEQVNSLRRVRKEKRTSEQKREKRCLNEKKKQKAKNSFRFFFIMFSQQLESSSPQSNQVN